MKKLSLAILVAFLTQVVFAENLKWEDADCRFEKITSKSQTDIKLDPKNDVDSWSAFYRHHRGTKYRASLSATFA